MTFSPVTSSALNLNSEDLFYIAEEISTKYSPIIPKKKSTNRRKIALIPKQMLEISHEITRNYSLKLNPLKPKLVVLPIDPGHLFAAWNLGQASDIAAKSDLSPHRNFVLRIYQKQGNQTGLTETNDWIDIPVDLDRTRQTIKINPLPVANTFIAAIGYADKDSKFSVLAFSQAVHSSASFVADATSSDGVNAPASNNGYSASVQAPLTVPSNISSISYK